MNYKANSSLRFKSSYVFVLLLLILISAQLSFAQASHSIQLAWDKNTESNVDHYVVSYWRQSLTYPKQAKKVEHPRDEKIKEISCSLSLEAGETYILIKAYDASSGEESDYSEPFLVVLPDFSTTTTTTAPPTTTTVPPNPACTPCHPSDTSTTTTAPTTPTTAPTTPTTAPTTPTTAPPPVQTTTTVGHTTTSTGTTSIISTSSSSSMISSSSSSSTTTSVSSLWPIAYDKMWGAGKKEKLLLLRTFRDEILLHTEIGRKYIFLLYDNSLEIAVLLLQEPLLAAQTIDFTDDILRSIELLLYNDELEIDQDTMDDFVSLLDNFESKASPKLKTAIRKMKSDIDRSEVFEIL
jgi:hypothetical protein